MSNEIEILKKQIEVLRLGLEECTMLAFSAKWRELAGQIHPEIAKMIDANIDTRKALQAILDAEKLAKQLSSEGTP